MLRQKKFIIHRVKKKLIVGFSRRAGRNFFGRKTILTQGGGVFTKIRILNFKRNLIFNGILLIVEKDVKRTGFIGLICYENGLFSYVLLPYGVTHKGDLLYGFSNKFCINSSTFLLNVPTGNFVHHIESMPNNGAKLTRAAGSSSFIISKEVDFVFIKMNSGWLLKLSKYCIAVNGLVSNVDHHITRIKNAGKKRRLGVKPKVRGVAMNPCDHPHGGGEGTGSPPKAHKTP
jgi:large subunit ribosomal protein L2